MEMGTAKASIFNSIVNLDPPERGLARRVHKEPVIKKIGFPGWPGLILD